jgi:putative hydrolase of the HAD superfamily
MTGRAVEAVTFDFWNTLIAEGSSGDAREGRWARALQAAGHDVDQAGVERAMTDLWSWFNGEWAGNRVVGPDAIVAQAITLLDVEPTPELVDEMVATLHEGWDPAVMRTAPGIGEVLEALKAGGLRLGIICDVGMTPSATLRRYLEHHDFLQFFDGWSFSDEVGVYKPDPAIYVHARETLAVGGHVAHVGDLRRTDVAGALAMGWTAIRYAGFYDDQSDRPEADHVIRSHAELPALLLG